MLTTLLVLLSATTSSHAALRDYDSQAVEWSFRRGEIVVLDFHIKHCPLCHSESSALEKVVAKELREGKLQAFVVDFDTETQLRQKYRVKYRDTALFLYRRKEVARMAGEFRHETLAQALTEARNTALTQIAKERK